MKKIYLFIILFSPLSLLAQEKKIATKILIGYTISPDYSFRALHNDGGSAV